LFLNSHVYLHICHRRPLNWWSYDGSTK